MLCFPGIIPCTTGTLLTSAFLSEDSVFTGELTGVTYDPVDFDDEDSLCNDLNCSKTDQS